MTEKLDTHDHSREAAGLTYIYPVVSRRARGVSVGINLNPNNACNWRCIYCQVPNLARGAAPEIDLALLETELRGFLNQLLTGSFMVDRVPEEYRRFNDIAISGNGEPTSSRQFVQVIELIRKLRLEESIPESVKTVLITNGSLMHKKDVQRAIAVLSQINGEIWFKLDSASEAGRLRINRTRISNARVLENLKIAAGLCPTLIQSCVFEIDGKPPAATERAAYLELLRQIQAAGVRLRGVLLYGIARDSMQPEAARLSPVTRQWLDEFSTEISGLGLPVSLSF